MTICVHGTCVDIGGHGVLLMGPSGSGKSDLALRLMDHHARLVADDQTQLDCVDGMLLATPPAALAGLMEVRGLGLLRMPFVASTRLRLVVDLSAAPERLPEPESRAFLGISLPCVTLAAFEASATTKVRLAVGCATGDIIAANG